MKLAVRTAVLTLCVAGAAAAAMTPNSALMMSHALVSTAHPAPETHPIPGGGWGPIFK